MIADILDFLFPRYCVMCGERLKTFEKGICLHCNVSLPRTYHWQRPYDNPLAKRYYGRIPINKAVSYIHFHPKTDTAQIVYQFKYHSQPYLARQIGRMMAQEIGEGFFNDIDAIVPIPITRSRQRHRGYNQSEQIAFGISSVTGINVCSNLVKRVTNTVSQTTLSYTERVTNIEGVFKLSASLESKRIKNYVGKHLLVIDDVITTGSTTIECANQLLMISGVKISVISFASVT